MTNSPGILKLLTDTVRSKKFLVTFASLALLFSPLVATSITEKEHEGYLTMSVLGGDMKGGQYFTNSSMVSVGDEVKWYVDIHNGMDAEYLSIRIKLLNSTQVIPDDVSNQASPAPTIFEMRHLIAKNGTLRVPLSWSIVETATQDSDVFIKRIAINGEEISTFDLRSINGQNFRMVLELWRYDNNTNEFEFAWSSDNNKRSVWNQIWFSVNS